jgi:hypothetical protein
VSNGEPTYDERIAAIAAYEGSFSEMEKLALETLARTARDPLFCFELSMSMMRLRQKVNEARRKLPKK